MGLSSNDLNKSKESSTDSVVSDSEYKSRLNRYAMQLIPVQEEFVKDIKHVQMGPWHQYDVLLDAAGYGWEYILDSADYVAGADLIDISEVKAGDLSVQAIDITDSYHRHNDKCCEMPELKNEYGFLSLAGNSLSVEAPMKIVWMNQTRVLRFFTLIDDETLLRTYAESVVSRSFVKDEEPLVDERLIEVSLFLIPIAFEGDPEYIEEPDFELHFGVREAQMMYIGSKLICSDLPKHFSPAETASKKNMHYQTLEAPDGKKYIPLFTSYNQMISIFGEKIRIGVICIETAKGLVLEENLDGIVLSPGSWNRMIPQKELFAEKDDGDERKKNKINPVTGKPGECRVSEIANKLRPVLENEKVSNAEIIGLVMKIDQQIRRCHKNTVCIVFGTRKIKDCITNTAHYVSEMISGLDAEEYIDLINMLATGFAEDPENMESSIIPELIDDYEIRMKTVLVEHTRKLRKIANKLEWKATFSISNEATWADDFINLTDKWFRYVRPLIIVAKERDAENIFVHESVKCLEELASKTLYRNDEAAYKLTTAFVKRFADVPSVLGWAVAYNELANDHLKRMKRFYRRNNTDSVISENDYNSRLKQYAMQFIPGPIDNVRTQREMLSMIKSVFPFEDFMLGTQIQSIFERHFLQSPSAIQLLGIVAEKTDRWMDAFNKESMLRSIQHADTEVLLRCLSVLTIYCDTLKPEHKVNLSEYNAIICTELYNRGFQIPVSEEIVPVRLVDRSIHIDTEKFTLWKKQNQTLPQFELWGTLPLNEKTPTISLYEDGIKTRDYCLQTEEGEDFTGKYFHVSVRLGIQGDPSVPIAQIDGFVSENPEKQQMSSEDIGYRMEGHFLASGGEAGMQRFEMNRGQDLIMKGLKYPGYTTPSNIRLIGICPECGKSFVFHGYACYMRQHDVAYSDDGLDCVEIQAFDIDKETWKYETDGKTFRYYNSFCCPHCGKPYIDYKKYPENKVFGVSGCVHLGRNMYHAE